MVTPVKNAEKRVSTDRRNRPTPIMSRYTFYGGQRKVIRRGKESKKHIYVDLYSTRLLIAAISLLILSCLDAFLTLELIGNGSVVEANPLMAILLNHSETLFAITKFTITATALTVLVLFKNVKITRICLPCAIKMYILVIAYELYLFTI